MGARAPARRRTYSLTASLFAREDLRFSGRPVATRAVVPEEYFSSVRQRRVLWENRKVDHEQDLPRKTSPAPTALPAVTVQPAHSLYDATCVVDVPPGFAAGGTIVAPTVPSDSQHVAFKATPGETVYTPPIRNKRR